MVYIVDSPQPWKQLEGEVIAGKVPRDADRTLLSYQCAAGD